MIEFLETAAPYFKILGTLFAALLGGLALFGETHKKGNLTPLGWWLLSGIALAGSVALATVIAEDQANAKREKEQQRQYAENVARLDSALFRLRVISDSLGRLRSLSRTALARQDSQLTRTVGLSRALRENSDTQASLLAEQRSLAVETARLLYPLSTIAAEGRFVYRLRDPPLDNYSAMVRRKVDSLYLHVAQAVQRDPRLRPRGGVVAGEQPVYYDPVTPRLVVGRADAVVFGQLPGLTADSATSVDSVLVRLGSEWLPKESSPNELDVMHVELSFRRRISQRAEIPDLIMLVTILETELQPGQPAQEFSSGQVVFDFVRGTVAVSFGSNRVTRAYSNGTITSILDLPGSTITVSSPGVAFGPDIAYPVRSEEFRLRLEAGRGRTIGIPGRAFEAPDIEGAFFTYEFSVSDLETHPGEFSRLFPATPLPGR